jgi:hypothetical protein
MGDLDAGDRMLYLAIFALFAIIAALYPYQKQPLPKWPYNLSINSLISIYVGILEAAIGLILGQGNSTFHSSAKCTLRLTYKRISQFKWTWWDRLDP